MGAKSTNNNKGLNHISDGHLLEYFRNTFIRGGGGTNAPTILNGLTATGGVISDYNTPPGAIYRAHIFTSSGTFDVTAPGDFGDTVEYLVVAGGGAGGSGGYRLCGGGGAGGLLSNHPDVPTSAPTGAIRQSAYSVSPGSYTITIGAGGAGATDGTIVDGNASNFYPTPVSYPSPTYLRAFGGGGGGGNPNPPVNAGSNTSGNSGGSGGGNTEGGGVPFLIGGGGSGTVGQGSNGGRTGSGNGAAGGGGAGEAGGQDDNGPIPANPPGAYNYGGHGGDGMQVRIAGSPTTTQSVGTPGTNPGGGYFAGGGGGSYQPSTDAPLKGIGGEGGGGYGIIWPGIVNPFGQDGLSSTGGGGGGAAASSGPGRGGNGGSGIVVVRYQIGQLTATQKATGGAISYYDDGSGLKTIHTFTSSGTFATAPNWSAATVEYVVVAGGGGGQTGGGGAGGILTGTTPIGAHPVSTSIQVGAGGIGGRWIAAASANGTDSFFGPPITATGGGRGGGWNGGGNTASPGGSGGGGAGGTGPTPGGTGVAGPPRQGYNGGNGLQDPGGNQVAGAGGGGAGGQGSNGSGPPNVGGHGGTGVQLPSTFQNPQSISGPPYGGIGFPGPGSTYFWIAGGGGGSVNNAGTAGSGGGPGGPYAGAGPGNVGSTTTAGIPGATNSGSGGGSVWDSSAAYTQAGSGGSGIVLIAYPS